MRNRHSSCGTGKPIAQSGGSGDDVAEGKKKKNENEYHICLLVTAVASTQDTRSAFPQNKKKLVQVRAV